MRANNVSELIISDSKVGIGHPVFVIAEVGINHNGSLDIAFELMEVAAKSGCNAVKFQKRNPDVCVPISQRDNKRDTPWGVMTYLEYKKRIEFDRTQYLAIDNYAKELGLIWFASPWDLDSVDFLEELDVPCYKVASASLTDERLLEAIVSKNKPVLLSTGMSTLDEIDAAVKVLSSVPLALAQSTSTYPAKLEHLNLRAIQTLSQRYGLPTGYSGHETGIPSTIAAVALGACFIERHITLNRAMWGTDQAASLEPHGLNTMVRHIRSVEQALGDGVKQVYDDEIPVREKLRLI